MTVNDFWTISPLLSISIVAMIVLLADLWTPRDRKGGLVALSIIGLAVTAFFILSLWGKGLTAFGGSVVADGFSLMFQLILVIVAALSVLLSEKYVQIKGINFGEYYALLLFSTSGAMLMATSRELITIFVGLEVLSIALYVLSGFARTEARSEESAMKYFLLGAFSSGFFLYGIALIYGGLQTTRLDEIAALPHSALATPYAIAGVALLIVGLGFKAAIVPFHSWTPDVYEGAPTSVTAFMSAGAKAGAFAAFIRVAAAFLPVSYTFHNVVWVLAALTMIVGNVLAVQQSNVKRMLAYSSIAHAGYILVGLLAQNPEGRGAVLFYVLAYTFMNLGAFGMLILLARRGQELNTIDDLKGLGRVSPAAGGVMVIFMLSLGGIPPTVGFFGKWFLFMAAIHSGLYGLAYLGLLASVVGVFYYLRIIWSMYFEAPTREFPANLWTYSAGAPVALGICAVASIVLGVLPNLLWPVCAEGGNSITAPTAIVAPSASTGQPALPQAAQAPVAAVASTGPVSFQ
jgi:NADH-quinone oxidoreductase subunit N